MITRVAATSAHSTNTSTLTTPPIDTTGASLLVIAVGYISGTPPTISDSRGNTFVPLAEQFGGHFTGRLFYVALPKAGPGHTVTVTHSNWQPSITFAAYKDTALIPFDVSTGAISSNALTLATGSLTPALDNSLFVTGVICDTPQSISDGFTIVANEAAGASWVGVALAEFIQGAKAAKNPAWTQVHPSPYWDMVTTIIVFKELIATPGNLTLVNAQAGGAIANVTFGLTANLGTAFVVGASPINVIGVGRYKNSGNAKKHTVNIRDGNGVLVATGVSDLATGSVGTWVYVPVGPVTLAAGGTYSLTSSEVETAGQDTYLDSTTAITSAVADIRQAWAEMPTVLPNGMGDIAQASAWYGMRFQVGSTIRVTALGRVKAPQPNTKVHKLNLVQHPNTLLATATVSFASSAGVNDRFSYADLATPVTLVAGTVYYLYSDETAPNTEWFRSTDNAGFGYDKVNSAFGAISTDGLNLQTIGNGGVYGPVGMLYAPLALDGTQQRARSWGTVNLQLGALTVPAVGASAGSATVSGVGRAIKQATGTAAGSATAAAVGRASVPGVTRTADGISAGGATAYAIGRSIAAATGIAEGFASVEGVAIGQRKFQAHWAQGSNHTVGLNIEPK